MSPGARGDILTDRPAPGRRDVPPPKLHYGYPPPYYPGLASAQANTWLGAPLISMANNRRGGKPFVGRDDIKRRDDAYAGRHVQLSKMALQAQGAPLIIQGRYGNQRKFTPPSDLRGYRRPEGKPFIAYDRCDTKPENSFTRNSTTACQGRAANMDAVSVASDESSGSANSEAALPRIIKPRKRRKKDRKPTNLVAPHEIVSRKHDVNEDCGESLSPASGAIYQVQLYDDALPPIANYRGDATVPYHSETKLVDYSEGLLMKHYPFGGLTITDDADSAKYGRGVAACEASESVSCVCQCRYCNPSGQIWDIDSVGFSELFDENSTVDFAPTKLEDSMKVVGSNSKKLRDVKERDATLRRSWSDPSSSHSTTNRKIGDDASIASGDSVSSTPDLFYSLFSSPLLTTRAGDLFGRSMRLSTDGDPSSYRLVPDLKLDTRSDSPSVNLEVSSEIVTSLNGHRDLEIKFFSTSPPAVASRVDSFFAESIVKLANSECQSETKKASSEVLKETIESREVENKLKSETLSEVT